MGRTASDMGTIIYHKGNVIARFIILSYKNLYYVVKGRKEEFYYPAKTIDNLNPERNAL